MKRKILLIFAVVYLFTSVFACAQSQLTNNNQNIQSLNSITELENDIYSDQKLSRQDMVVLIYKMMHSGEVLTDEKNETPFTDLVNPEFNAIISWANRMNVIKGSGATEFNPLGKIVLQDAYTMLIRALGYDKEQDLVYPQDYVRVATELGLGNNLDKDIDITTPLGAEDAEIIIKNSTEIYSNIPNHPLNNKKVIFIGNSFTYFGKTVIEKKQTILDQKSRSNDKGYFYQMCNRNMADVMVTNWTFGGHSLTDLMGGNCSADRGCDGEDHFSHLTDRNFDYVIFQPGSGDSGETLLCWASVIVDEFKKVNPDTKFLCLIHSSYLLRNSNVSVLDVLDDVENMGVTIVDWGRVVYDVVKGNTKVPGTKLDYNQNTFIISKTETDGYHPSMLSGYITSLMTYCSITGEKAQGQPYSFINNNEILHGHFNASAFVSKHYKYNGATTNFPEIFKSPSEMQGVQMLVDMYLKK